MFLGLVSPGLRFHPCLGIQKYPGFPPALCYHCLPFLTLVTMDSFKAWLTCTASIAQQPIIASSMLTVTFCGERKMHGCLPNMGAEARVTLRYAMCAYSFIASTIPLSLTKEKRLFRIANSSLPLGCGSKR